MQENTPAVTINRLSFAYPPPTLGGSQPSIFHNVSLEVPVGSRVLLVGANGVGKTTLLRLIAGQHLLPTGSLLVFGMCPFRELAALPPIALVDGEFPLHVDLSVTEVLANPTHPVTNYSRLRELMELLAVDPTWRMSRVSEGQRRRVQLLLALRRPVTLLLLDEVTAHLDLAARDAFLGWLRRESVQNGLTVIYATHILDGLGSAISAGGFWPTHLALIRCCSQPLIAPIGEFSELQNGAITLHEFCAKWVRGGSPPDT